MCHMSSSSSGTRVKEPPLSFSRARCMSFIVFNLLFHQRFKVNNKNCLKFKKHFNFFLLDQVKNTFRVFEMTKFHQKHNFFFKKLRRNVPRRLFDGWMVTLILMKFQLPWRIKNFINFSPISLTLSLSLPLSLPMVRFEPST